MGNGVSGDQGNLPSYGKRDVGATFDRKQHDWSEQARAQEVNTLLTNANSYINIIIIINVLCDLITPLDSWLAVGLPI